MSSIRFSFVLLTALQALSACANHPDSTAPTGPARAFYRRAKVWLDRFMGGALALLGLRLALASR